MIHTMSCCDMKQWHCQGARNVTDVKQVARTVSQLNALGPVAGLKHALPSDDDCGQAYIYDRHQRRWVESFNVSLVRTIHKRSERPRFFMPPPKAAPGSICGKEAMMGIRVSRLPRFVQHEILQVRANLHPTHHS